MTKESDFQAKIVKNLRAHGCIVLKYQQNATTRAGVPDIIGLKDGFWFALEVKRSRNAPFRPGQKEMIEKMDGMSFARVVYPENYEKVMAELEDML